MDQLLRAAGCPKINLQVRKTNAAVIAFYESIGFSLDVRAGNKPAMHLVIGMNCDWVRP